MTRAVRVLSPVRIAGVLAGLVVAAGVVLYLVPSNDYLLLPDGAHAVAPLVHVQGGHDPKGPGGVYFVDVFERRASMLESLFPFIRSGSTMTHTRRSAEKGLRLRSAIRLATWSMRMNSPSRSITVRSG